MSTFTLRTLEAELKRHYIGPAGEGHGRTLPDGTTQWGGFDTVYLKTVERVADADSVMFLCPLCFAKNGGAAGTHRVFVSFAGRDIPMDAGSRNSDGQPSRWQVAGEDIDSLSCTPSVLLSGPQCGWHGFVGSNGISPGSAG